MTGPTAHQALYRRWRAQTFAQIVGQQAVVTTLRNAVRLGQLSHALLFVGPRGTGKTSMARIVAKAVNCLDLREGEPCDKCTACVAIREGRALDLIEIDAASNRGINEIRALREGLPYAPTDLRRKVYILDEAHQITRDAWNALLKSLEEPPEHVTFIFASTEPAGFPAAILSRLQRFDFRPLTVPEIEGKLRTILEADGRAADPDALTLVATLAAGGMRDAESMLDQLLAAGDERLTADQVRDLLGLADSDAIDGFLVALARGDAAAGVRILDRLEERGRDVRTFVEQLVDAIRLTLLAGPRGRSGATAGPREALLSAARRLAGLDPSRSGPGGLRFQLELVLLEMSGSGAAAIESTQRASAAPAPGEADRRKTTPAPNEVDERNAAPATGAADGRKAATADEIDEAIVASSTDIDRRSAELVTIEPAPGVAPEIARPAEAEAARSDGSRVKAARPDRPPATSAPEPAASAKQPPGGQPPATQPPGPPDANPDLAQLLRRWPEIVIDVGRKPSVKPLIGACRPIGLDGNIVVLGFPENQVFLRDLLERRRAEIEEGISRHLGRPVGVRCVATNLDLAPAIPGDADAGLLLDEFHRIFAGDVADVPDVD